MNSEALNQLNVGLLIIMYVIELSNEGYIVRLVTKIGYFSLSQIPMFVISS